MSPPSFCTLNNISVQRRAARSSLLLPNKIIHFIKGHMDKPGGCWKIVFRQKGQKKKNLLFLLIEKHDAVSNDRSDILETGAVLLEMQNEDTSRVIREWKKKLVILNSLELIRWNKYEGTFKMNETCQQGVHVQTKCNSMFTPGTKMHKKAHLSDQF